MNGTQPETLGAPETTILKLFVQSLKHHPAYILVLAIIFLTLLLCIHAYTFGVSEPYLKQMGLGALAIESLMAFLLIRSVEAGKSHQRINELELQAAALKGRADSAETALKVADISDINIPNDAMMKHFASAIDNTRKALTFANKTFHEEIESSIASFDKETGEWSNGCLTTDAFNYERIIWKFYSLATRSVFCHLKRILYIILGQFRKG